MKRIKKLFEILRKKEVKKMKRMLSIILALAMTVSYVPVAKAEETANLGLTVTFDINNPPYWVIEPQDGSVTAGETITVYSLAEDPDGDQLYYGCRWYLNGVRQGPGELPEGATFQWKFAVPNDPLIRPDPTEYAPRLTWEVPETINLNDVHEFEFIACDRDYPDEESGNRISKKIRITIEEPQVIAISLEGPNPWVLENIALGQLVPNADEPGGLPTLHSVINNGNVPITLDIGYPEIQNMSQVIVPGTEQGVNTFITIVGDELLIPGQRLDTVTLLSLI